MRGRIRVLYVDDYPLDRELVRDALEKDLPSFLAVFRAHELNGGILTDNF